MEFGALSAAAPRPWLAPYQAVLTELALDPYRVDPTVWFAACNRYARQHHLEVAFVSPPAGRLRALDYERQIVNAGLVASRPNLHDVLNALVWLRFPQAKKALSRAHVEAAQPPGFAGVRGPRRDAVTHFDEHGVLFMSCASHWVERLRAHAWQDLWITERAGFLASTHSVVVGHGLLARLIAPHVQLTGHALAWVCPRGPWLAPSAWDGWLAGAIDRLASTAELSPLPVLGLPGWCARQDAAFYADRSVFRPARSARRIIHHP